VAQVAHRYEGKVSFIGMAGRDAVGPMRQFVARYQLGFFPHTADASGSLWARLGVSGQPAWIFIDRSGRSHTIFGAQSDQALEQELNNISA
jgi:hypothetical protein